MKRQCKINIKGEKDIIFNKIEHYFLIQVQIRPWSWRILEFFSKKILKFFFKPIQYLLLKKSRKIISLSNHYLNYSDDLKKFKHKIHTLIGVKRKDNSLDQNTE